MKPFWQSIAWVADTVLNHCWPLETEPSLDDLKGGVYHGGQTPDGNPPISPLFRDGEDEVGTGGRVGPDDVWPETPDPMDHLIDLLEQVRDLLSSAVSPDAAESPGSVVPPSDPGHQNLTCDFPVEHFAVARFCVGTGYAMDCNCGIRVHAGTNSELDEKFRAHK